jgi:uncharacterized protein (TIGR03083 family)
MTRLHHGTKDFWLAALRADGPALRAAAGEASPDRPVPSCPEWTVQELVLHVASLYRWVRSHVGRGVTSKPEPRPTSFEGLPTGPAALALWDEEYARLVQLLDALDPGLPAWNWAPQPKTAAFWHRRMAHETSVHRWDAQVAIAAAEPIEAKLAADGVTEVLDTWLPAGRSRGPGDRVGVVHLVATDAEQEWYLRLRGEGVALLDTDTILDTDDHHTRTIAVGTASDLVLAMFGRVPFDVLDVTGDPTLLEPLRTG